MSVKLDLLTAEFHKKDLLVTKYICLLEQCVIHAYKFFFRQVGYERLLARIV